ncbi:MAG: response regulator transcription factor [Bryobacteraceae bacterium]
MKELQIVISDDPEALRGRLQRLLKRQAASSIEEEAHRSVPRETHRHSVTVFDASAPSVRAVDLHRLRRSEPQMALVVMTVHDLEQVALDLTSAGNAGAARSNAANHLIAAVRALSPKAAAGQELPEPPAAPTGARSGSRRQLSPREREVLRLLAEGRTHRQVATLLKLSVRTVDSHCANIMAKLGAHSLSELVRYAIRHQIVAA